MEAGAPLVSIVVPVLDERLGAERLVAAAAAWGAPWPFELVFVDGGSDDGTAEVVRACPHPWARLLQLPRGAGLAAAWRAGLDAARGVVQVTMDGDGVHTLAGVECLVDEVLGGADLTIARRYGPGGSGMPGRTWRDRLGSRLAARSFAARFRLALRDPLHGFRARSARSHDALRPRLDGIEGNVFLGWEAAWAIRLGQRVTEIAIPYGRRHGGREKKRLWREALRLARALSSGLAPGRPS
jgi:dolichol-phosphate mannosyltransferase